MVALLLAMFASVAHEAWPSFAHNGLGWSGSGGNVDSEIEAIFNSGSAVRARVHVPVAGRPRRLDAVTDGAAARRPPHG